jgi:hypothetical protein
MLEVLLLPLPISLKGISISPGLIFGTFVS